MKKLFTVFCSDNGYILIHEATNHKESENEYVKETESFEDIADETAEDPSIASFGRLLWSILNTYGPSTSRYSKERLIIDIQPGDKYDIN